MFQLFFNDFVRETPITGKQLGDVITAFVGYRITPITGKQLNRSNFCYACTRITPITGKQLADYQ